MQQSNTSKQEQGRMSFHAGAAAEGAVGRIYARRGGKVLAERWRGSGGEIDLIVQIDEVFVFVEVKKSSSFARAALRISQKQRQRIFATALEFVATQPAGQLSDMRFDVALVDGTGAVEIIENALYGD